MTDRTGRSVQVGVYAPPSLTALSSALRKPFHRMRLITLSLLFMVGTAVSAQAPFLRIYPMTEEPWFSYGGAIDQEGHFIIVQESSDNDVVLSRITPDGEHLWTKQYPLFTEEGFYENCNVVATDDGGIMIAGYTMGNTTIARDGFLMKMDLDGNIISQQRVHAGASSNAFHSLHKGANGYFAAGRADGTAGYDMLLAKIEEDGTIAWSRTFGGSSNSEDWDWARSATQLSDGGYVVVGYGDGIGTTATSGFVVRTDALGNELWARVVSSGVSVEDIIAVTEGSNGDIYLGGRSLGLIVGEVSAFIVKLNSAGQYQWTRVLERGVEVADLHPGPDGGVTWLAVPEFTDGPGRLDIGWGQMDANGTTVRMHVYGDAAGQDRATNMEPLPGGGWVIFGSTNSHRQDSNAGHSPFILTIDEEGNSDCWEIEPARAWTSADAVVTPFTSIAGQGFQTFPMTTGAVALSGGTLDPCCAVTAGYEATNNGFEWTFTNTSTGADSFLWDLGDGTVSQEVSPVHTYADNGTYTVCLTAFGDCGEPVHCTDIGITVGIDDATRVIHVDVFPSPAHGSFTVRSNGQRISSVQLFDAGGRMVMTHAGMLAQRTEVPVAGLATGIYTVQVTLATGDRVRSRVAVN